jgi:hypothetical protein
MSRIDVAEVDVRSSERKGAEEKVFHGEACAGTEMFCAR